jgi:hypothetical protein
MARGGGGGVAIYKQGATLYYYKIGGLFYCKIRRAFQIRLFPE